MTDVIPGPPMAHDALWGRLIGFLSDSARTGFRTIVRDPWTTVHWDFWTPDPLVGRNCLLDVAAELSDRFHIKWRMDRRIRAFTIDGWNPRIRFGGPGFQQFSGWFCERDPEAAFHLGAALHVAAARNAWKGAKVAFRNDSMVFDELTWSTIFQVGPTNEDLAACTDRIGESRRSALRSVLAGPSAIGRRRPTPGVPTHLYF